MITKAEHEIIQKLKLDGIDEEMTVGIMLMLKMTEWLQTNPTTDRNEKIIQALLISEPQE